MSDRFDRVKKIFGDSFSSIENLKVIVFGVGGVGSFAIDCLYRSGVRDLTVVDSDCYEETNRNRQIGSDNNIGRKKVDILQEIYQGIRGVSQKVTQENIDSFELDSFDIVIDAIDDLKMKIELAKRVDSRRFISSMGSANKLDPTKIEVVSIWKTHGDPLARRVRSELRKSGFKGDYRVIFSSEEPIGERGGSFSAVTGSFGLTICSETLNRVTKNLL